MEYIYDIVLNFNDCYYEFYEWNNKDKIINVKKIPVYRINDIDYLSFKYNKVSIINKFNQNYNIYLVTNTLEVMAIMLDKSGNIIKRSSLLLEEADEVLEISEKLEISTITYKKNISQDKTIISRSIKEKYNFIASFFKNINLNKDKYLLKYIYYDIYNIIDDDINKIYNKLLNEKILIKYIILLKIYQYKID